MATTLTYRFYEVKTPKSLKDPFHAMSQALSNVGKAVLVDGTPLRVESYHDDAGIIYGTASRTDMNDLPHVITPHAPGTKDLKDYGMTEDDGLGRPTSFLLTQRGGQICLVFQFNWNGLRVGGFLELIQRHIGCEPFEALTIVEPERLEEVLQWGVYRRLQARIAHPSTKAVYESKTVTAAATASSEAEALVVGLDLAMGRKRKGSLAHEAIRTTVKDLLGMEAGNVQSLVISGMRSDENLMDQVDLLHHRLAEIIDVPGRPRTIGINVLESAVRQAYTNADAKLSQHFGA